MSLTFDKLTQFNLLDIFQNKLFGDNHKILFEYLNLCQNINTTDTVIKEMPSFPGSTDKITRDEMINAIGSTLALENINLDKEEIEESFRKTSLHEKLQRREQEAENSRKVYEFIKNLDFKKNTFEYSEPLIKQIHTYFTRNMNYLSSRPGEYRTDFAVSFGDPPRVGLCRSSLEIEDAMAKYIDWLNTPINELLPYKIFVKAIMAHYYLTEIHPFGDGNGRTARAVEALVLYENGINSYCFWSLSNFWSLNRDKYITSLGEIRETCDSANFIMWGLEGYLGELTRIKNKIRKKVSQLMLLDYARYLFKNQKSKEIRMLSVLELLTRVQKVKEKKFFNSPAISALYNKVSAATKHRDLKKLQQLRLVKISQNEDNIVYMEPNYSILDTVHYNI